MKKVIRKRTVSTMNIIQCEGAACISMNSNINRYYAQGVSSRRLTCERIKYE